MTITARTGELDERFSSPDASPTPWSTVRDRLEGAETYWITPVRDDGRPHSTPLVGVWLDDAFWFSTGPSEQKARNLEHNPQVALTTGTNTWAEGLDVVVEGTAVRVTERVDLQRLADAYETKYGSVWHFDVGDGVFGEGEDAAAVFRIEPAKVLAFAKEPHAHTSFRFS
jgi:hypothetical protein